MKVSIKVVPNSKKNLVKDEDSGLKVYLTAPAVDGKANKTLINFLAEHFNIRRNKIEIIKGLKSRSKTISIDGI